MSASLPIETNTMQAGMLEVRPRYLAALVLEELCSLAMGGR